MVGNGPLENQLKVLAEPHDFIRFIPFQNQSQMPIVYRLGDILCLPSKGPGETWGLAINEAMASGRPVIVTDKVGCAQDLLRDR
jgi:glycosyltransferase involved in cell wall biosynthesis